MTDLKAMSDAATQGNLISYGELDVGLDYEPFFGSPGVGGMHPLQPMGYADQDFVIALWNEYRAGTIGDTAAAEARGYERGLREAAEVASSHQGGFNQAHDRTCRRIDDAILAKLEDK